MTILPQMLREDFTFRREAKKKCMGWVSRNVWLSKRFTAREGFYNVAFTPYLKPIHEWFGDTETRSIVAPKGAQIGFTTAIANCMSFAVCEDPGPILYVTSTDDNAKSWGEREWLPRIETCRALQALKPRDMDSLRKQEQHFKSCTVRLVGAQSENNLASRPIRYGFFDEVDKYPKGHLGLAEARLLSYRGMEKAVIGSTTTLEDGPVWLRWLKSTMHQWHVECPECKAWQVMDFFKHVKWNPDHRDKLGRWNIDAVKEDAWRECEHCQVKWSDVTVSQIVRSGEARKTNENAANDAKGLHLPSLLSPYLRSGDLAALWLTKKDQPGGRQDFFNNYLGLPFSHDEWSINETKLLELRREDFVLRECPEMPAVVTFCADCGEKEQHWSVEARMPDGTAYLLDYGTCHTIEDLLPTFERLSYPITGRAERVKPQGGLVDSGYRPEMVYRMCSRSGGRLNPSKGTGAEWGKPIDFSRIPAFPAILLHSYVDYIAKCSLYIDTIGRQSHPRLYWPANVGPEFVDGHSGQELRSKQTPRGTQKFFKLVVNDHYGDCSKLHLVAWWVLRQRFGQELPTAAAGR